MVVVGEQGLVRRIGEKGAADGCGVHRSKGMPALDKFAHRENVSTFTMHAAQDVSHRRQREFFSLTESGNGLTLCW